MPSSKTDTSIRFPESEDQHRRIRGVTQDRKWEARMRDAAGRNLGQPSHEESGPESNLELHMDESGEPQSEPWKFSNGNRPSGQGPSTRGRNHDMVSAANDVR